MIYCIDLLFPRRGKCQTVTHCVKTDRIELCYWGSDFYNSCDKWVKFGTILMRCIEQGVYPTRVHCLRSLMKWTSWCQNRFEPFRVFFGYFFSFLPPQVRSPFPLHSLFTLLPLKFLSWQSLTKKEEVLQKEGAKKIGKVVHALVSSSLCMSCVQCDHSWHRLQLSHLASCDVWDCGSLSTNKGDTLWRIQKGLFKCDWWWDDPMRWDEMR